MSLVMDGVRPTAARRASVVVPKRAPAVQPIVPAPRRYIVGMDGIRRPAPISPREMLTNMQSAPAEIPQAVAAKPSFSFPAVSWRLPSAVAWKRPAIAFGLVATALIASGVTVNALATPKASTAHAEAPAANQPAPVKAAAVAPAPTPTPQKAGLQELLNNFAAGNLDKFGIVVKDLKTGNTASINADRQIESASLYKLFVAQRIYQRIDVGQLDYGQAAGGGTGRNINDCLTIMINISDNGCGRALGSILGWGSQDTALKLEGYNNTSLQTPQQTSAADVATLFTRLYEGTLVSPGSSAKFLGLLKDQRVNNRLPVGLPAGTVIAHKTGDLDGVVHDAGIVYGPKTDYLVVVTSGPWNSPGNAPAMFADLSSKLWNFFQQ